MMVKKVKGGVLTSFDTLLSLAGGDGTKEPSTIATAAPAAAPTPATAPSDTAQAPHPTTFETAPTPAQMDAPAGAKGPGASTIISTAPVEEEMAGASEALPASEFAGYEPYNPNKTYKVGDRILLPLELMAENPRNPRVFFHEHDLTDLAASLAANGQMEAGLVYPKRSDGKFPIKGGHRRRVGLQMLNKEVMKVEIVARPATELEEYKQARALNKDSAKPSYLEDALRFKELLTDGVAPDQTTLGLAVGVSKGDMSKLLSIAELPRLLLEPMAENIDSFGMSSAYAIYRYWTQTGHNEDSTLALIQTVKDGRLSVRALEAKVKEETTGTVRPPVKREHAVKRAALTGSGEGELKAYGAGKLTFEATKLEPEIRDQVYARLLAICKDFGLVEAGATGDGNH